MNKKKGIIIAIVTFSATVVGVVLGKRKYDSLPEEEKDKLRKNIMLLIMNSNLYVIKETLVFAVRKLYMNNIPKKIIEALNSPEAQKLTSELDQVLSKITVEDLNEVFKFLKNKTRQLK